MTDTVTEITENELLAKCFVIFLALQQVDFSDTDKLAELLGRDESGLFSRHLKLL
jgi:hypothetical protein